MTDIFAVHYHKDTGELRAWGNDDGSQTSFAGSDFLIAHFSEWYEGLTPALHRIDPATSLIIDKTAQEKRPTQREVETAVHQELMRSDTFMLPDYPIPDSERRRWITYRRMLRELSRLPGVEEMIEAWQLAPDDIDPITNLRERLKS